jgi:predicted metalloprotease
MSPIEIPTSVSSSTRRPAGARRPRRVLFLTAALLAVSSVSLTACSPVELLIDAATSGSTPGSRDGEAGSSTTESTDETSTSDETSTDTDTDTDTGTETETDGSDGDGGTTDDGYQEDGDVETDTTSDDVTREFLEDIDDAVAVTDQFWATHWSEFFTESYTAPVVFGLYDGYDPSTDPGCNGQPLGPENAFYCPTDDLVAWDWTLMADGYVEGDSWVYLVVAHEWGHAIQARLSDELIWQASELQADCFAGAALFGAAADGTLLFESGDQKEIATGLIELADETPWTDSADHGDSFDRIDAFDLGRRYGVNGCLPAE